MMQPSLSQVCSLDSSFEEDLEGFSGAECRAVEIWLTKLETFLETHDIEQAKRLLKEHRMTAAAASYQGGLLASQGEVRSGAWDLFRQRLDLCEQLDIPTIVVACDIPAPLSQQTIERTQASLLEAAQEAGRRRRRVALEFQRSAALGDNLQTAAALVHDVGSPHLGLCLDVFHYYTGPSMEDDLRYLSPQNLFHVQLCDLADRPRELAADADRILPTDGDLPLASIIRRLREIEYDGYVSIEVMNPQIWRIPADQFAHAAMPALNRALNLQ